MTLILALTALNLHISPSFAQNPPQGIQDEGGTVERPAYVTNCTGPAVTCSQSGITGTIDVEVNSSDIEDLGASDGEVLWMNGATIDGNSDFTYDPTGGQLADGRLDLQNGDQRVYSIGLAGALPTSAVLLYAGAPTSSMTVGTLLSELTYTGSNAAAIGFQSDITHTGVVASPLVYGALASAYGGTNNVGINQYFGGNFNAGFADNTVSQTAGEISVFYGVSANAMQASRIGTSHDATSTIIALGVYVPNFSTPSGGTFVRHGLLMSEPLDMTPDAKIGFDAGIFTNATTVMYQDSVSGELRTDVSSTQVSNATTSLYQFDIDGNFAVDLSIDADNRFFLEGHDSDTLVQFDDTDNEIDVDVDGTRVLEVGASQIEAKVTVDGGRNLFYGTSQITHNISSGYTDIDWRETVEDDYYTHDNTTDPEQITIANGGLYRVTYNVCTDVTTGSSRSTSDCKLLEDVGAGFVDIADTGCHMYNRTASRGVGCCTTEILRDFDVEDILKLQCRRSAGTDTVAIVKGTTRINLEFMRDS